MPRAKKKKTRRRPRKKRRTGKRRQLGVLGKAGVVVMAVPPLASSAIEAGVSASNKPENWGLGDKALYGYYRFMNNLVSGFGLPNPYETMDVGGIANEPVGDGWGGANPHLWTTVAGGIMFGIDVLVAKFAKTSARIGGIPMTGKY